jgi:ADP-ribose pyrophosphatase YjhB (NUDIX family)
MLQFTQLYTYKDGRKFRLEVHTGSFDELDLTKAGQSYGIILNDKNEIVLSYNSDSENWILPGGSIEEGETPIEGLVREVYEESAVVVNKSTIKPAFYQEAIQLFDDGSEKYFALQLRYIARAKQIDEFISDPAGVMTEVKWVSLDELGDWLTWGQTVDVIKKVAQDYISK